jgi:hypothetical protein
MLAYVAHNHLLALRFKEERHANRMPWLSAGAKPDMFLQLNDASVSINFIVGSKHTHGSRGDSALNSDAPGAIFAESVGSKLAGQSD